MPRNLDDLRPRIEAAGLKTYNEHSFPGDRRLHFKDPGGNEIRSDTARLPIFASAVYWRRAK